MHLLFLFACLFGFWLGHASPVAAQAPGTPTTLQEVQTEATEDDAPAQAGEAAPADDAAPEVPPRYETGRVLAVAPGASPEQRDVTVKLTSGPRAGQEVTVHQRLTGEAGFDLAVAAGDDVMVVILPSGTVGSAGEDIQLADHQRAAPVGWVAAGVLALMLLIGGWRGLKTLLLLLLTGGAVIGVLLPLTLKGWSPLPVAVALSAAIALVTTLLTSGPGRKTIAAVLGASGAIALSAFLAAWAVGFTRLSGVASDEAMSAHAMTGGAIQFSGLLAASMLIGALGIVLDLALSISSAVDELRQAHPGLERGTLWTAGMQVGRDLLSTSGNTLLLAYLGGSLPVLLALGAEGLGLTRLIHQEALATEATTLLVGLAGLLTAIPLTAAIAALLQPASIRGLGSALDS